MYPGLVTLPGQQNKKQDAKCAGLGQFTQRWQPDLEGEKVRPRAAMAPAKELTGGNPWSRWLLPLSQTFQARASAIWNSLLPGNP